MLPVDFEQQLPLYEPFPLCGRDNGIFDYVLVGDTPDWVTIDNQKRVITGWSDAE